MEAFDWRAYLHHSFVVVRLQSQGELEDQARARSAMSRGYYALHNVAREYAVLFMSFKQEENYDKAHSQLVRLMDKAGGPEERVVSRLLDETRAWRNAADYDAEPFGKSLSEVEVVLVRIKKAIGSIDTLRKRREAVKR